MRTFTQVREFNQAISERTDDGHHEFLDSIVGMKLRMAWTVFMSIIASANIKCWFSAPSMVCTNRTHLTHLTHLTHTTRSQIGAGWLILPCGASNVSTADGDSLTWQAVQRANSSNVDVPVEVVAAVQRGALTEMKEIDSRIQYGDVPDNPSDISSDSDSRVPPDVEAEIEKVKGEAAELARKWLASPPADQGHSHVLIMITSMHSNRRRRTDGLPIQRDELRSVDLQPARLYGFHLKVNVPADGGLATFSVPLSLELIKAGLAVAVVNHDTPFDHAGRMLRAQEEGFRSRVDCDTQYTQYEAEATFPYPAWAHWQCEIRRHIGPTTRGAGKTSMQSFTLARQRAQRASLNRIQLWRFQQRVDIVVNDCKWAASVEAGGREEREKEQSGDQPPSKKQKKT